jgi:hypothetical protein
MKRLRDESAAEPLLARGIFIVRSTPATPSMPDARRRVWVALEIEAEGVYVREAMRPSALRVLALTAALLLIVGGTAAAVIGHRWTGPLLMRLTGTARAPSPARDGSGSAPRPQARPVAGPAVTSQALATPSSTKRRPPRAPSSRGSRGVAALPAPPPSAYADGQVLDAMVALRRDHDARRAADLLARYLADHPRGALREEALVLAIEAADARGDQRAVDGLAKQYHANYPSGRFHSFVEGHLDGGPK